MKKFGQVNAGKIVLRDLYIRLEIRMTQMQRVWMELLQSIRWKII